VALAGLLLCSSILKAEYRFLENGNPTLSGSDAGFLSDSPTRLKLDLAGTWKYEIEGGPSGTVKVPSAYDFTGKVTFERTFEVTSEMIDKYQFSLVMLGTNHASEVSLNGDFITNHSGGYTSFVQSIAPNVLQPGKENVIRVVVSNDLDARKTLPLRSNVWGWRNYGGILRDVFILATPKLAVNDVIIRTNYSISDASARITLDAGFEGVLQTPTPIDTKRPTTAGVYFELIDKITGFQAVKSQLVPLTRSGNEWDRVRVEALLDNPKVWTPESPELYQVKVYLVVGNAKDFTVIDEYDLNTGIRSLDVGNGQIYLNGKRVLLKGVVWQEDHPNYGSAMSHEELEKDVAQIKSLGANAIRFGSHPPHPYVLNLCDRYGLFALEELPVSGAPAAILTEENFVELASTMMKEMIGRDRHHVSVLAWGIGDEFESSSPAARKFVETLAAIAKSLDGRPVYYGTRIVDADACADLVDLAVINMHTQDIKLFKKQLEEWQQKNKGRPVIVGKFGSEVKQNDRNGYSDPLSYEAQARFYIQRFEMLKQLNYDGAFVWSYNDWKGDRPSLTITSGDPWIHSMGLVSYDREKRLAYDAVRSVFKGEKFVALPIGNYSANAPIMFVVSGLIVLIGSAYFYNVSRRFRDNLNRSVMNLYNFFADVRDQRIVSTVHSVVLAAIISVATAIVVSSVLYHFRQNWILDNLMSYLLVSDGFKEAAVRLVWSPLKCMGYLSGFFFILFLLLSLLIRAMSIVSRTRVYAYHAYVLSVWSATPLLILVPIGMILYRIMDSPVYVVPSLVLLLALKLWVVLRLFKGISIIFDAYLFKVYVAGFIAIACVLGVGYLYYDYTQSTSMYLSYMYNVMMSSQ
jgi:hypothetical protein